VRVVGAGRGQLMRVKPGGVALKSSAGLQRYSRRSDPGFSKSKEMDVARLGKIRYSSVFLRVEKRVNVKRIHTLKVVETDPGFG